MASSSSHSIASSKELLAVLNNLNENHKRKHEQQQEQEHDMQQQQKYKYLQYHSQRSDQQLEESSRQGEQKQSQQFMELSQIDLIYRAEGNANLVLALPQFKKVLRLPKISIQHKEKQLEHKAQYQDTQSYQKNMQLREQPQSQSKQQDEMNQQEPNEISTIGQQENRTDAVGILTMDHYVAYISIIRCLLGNGFVFEADIVAVPNPTDRHWINEHIKLYRPANRLDKEFGGHFGLLLPDATQLPAEFDILFPNLQCKTQSAIVTTATKTSHCSNSSRSYSDKSCSGSNNIFGSDTFAIEIKPKQGWLLPNDVNNLFDIKPKITQTTRITQPPSLREAKNALKAAVATTMSTDTATKALKTSTDTECFTTTQNEPSETIVSASATTRVRARASTISQTEVPTTSHSGSDRVNKTCETARDDKISHSLYDKVDTRCRYCCMQFLKMKQQKIVKRTQYCPIDLFSGLMDKMLFALQALFECPQNNLRIFRNGDLIFDDEKSRTITIADLFASDKLQLIKHLLVTCLLREYESKEEVKNEEKEQIEKDSTQQLLLAKTKGERGDNGGGKDEIETGTDTGTGIGAGAGAGAGVAVGQPQSSVTSCKKQKLSTMPKITATIPTTAKETEVTKVKSTLTSAKPIPPTDNYLTSNPDYNIQCLEQINKTEVACLPKNCVLQKILHLQSLAKDNLQFMLDHGYADRREKTYDIVCKLLEKFAKTQNELTLCQLSPEEQYILGATAMDCSVMITFCEIESVLEDTKQKAAGSIIDSPFVVSTSERRFLTKVTLLDLDPKPDTHFNKYFLQTKQILDAMKET